MDSYAFTATKTLLVAATLLSGLSISNDSFGQDFSGVRKANEDSVVFIHSQRFRKDGTGIKENSYGTGFIISRDGHVLTAAHVVLSDDKDTVVETKASVRSRHAHSYPIRTIKRDAEVDVVLLLLPDAGVEWKPVSRGDSKTVPKDAPLYSLGFPGGSDQAPATGLLSHKFGPRGTWQTTLPINRGNSGGPIFDLNGKFVAVASAGDDPSQQITFAIPEAYARGLIQIASLNITGESYLVNVANIRPSAGPTAISQKFTFYQAVDHQGAASTAESFCLPDQYNVTTVNYGITTINGDDTRLVSIGPDVSRKNCVTLNAFVKGLGVTKVGPIVVDHKGRGWLGVNMTVDGALVKR